eukprot:TRINITY_DN2857_c0_g1_i1.p2 TRINITY_DN2857_c0_g1~~TRINITY_DN2857_c0_g1_i1.p2  ORF type:complete len:170 (-),score=22.55 TRINITY_DN2857_c0_g1_i1:290-799(-)
MAQTKVPAHGADPYTVLQVGRSATERDIKSAYRRLALKHHPDTGGTEGAFAAVQEAYEVLGSKTGRAEYDSRNGGARPGFRRSYEVKRGFGMRRPPSNAYDFDAWNRAHYGAEDLARNKRTQRWKASQVNPPPVKRSMPWIMMQVALGTMITIAAGQQAYVISRVPPAK